MENPSIQTPPATPSNAYQPAMTSKHGDPAMAFATEVADAPRQRITEWKYMCYMLSVGGILWRFPYLSYIHGGAIFLLPYLICLVLIGMPIAHLETLFGRIELNFTTATARVRGSFIATTAFVLFVVAASQSVYVAWVIIYMIKSFKSGPLAWSTSGEGLEKTCPILVSNNNKHFFHTVLGMYDYDLRDATPSGNDGCTKIHPDSPMGIRSSICLVSFILWFVMAIYSHKRESFSKFSSGNKHIRRLTYAFLIGVAFFAIVRTFSLEGAGQGLKTYFNSSVHDSLSNPKIWADALSQVALSLGLGLGIVPMIRRGEVSPNMLSQTNRYIAFNAVASFIVGMWTYLMLGYVAYTNKHPLESIFVLPESYPVFFLMLQQVSSEMKLATVFTLCAGIAILFLTINGLSVFLTVLTHRVRFSDKSPGQFSLCMLGFLLSMFFSGRTGIYYLRLFDHFCITHIYLLAVAAISICIGWCCETRAVVGITAEPRRIYLATFWGAVVSWIILSVAIPRRDLSLHIPREIGCGFLIGFFVFALILVVGCAISFKKSKLRPKAWWKLVKYDSIRPYSSTMYTLCFKPNEANELGVVPMSEFIGTFYRRFWCVAIKYFVPVAMLFAVASNMRMDIHYSYPTPVRLSYPSSMISFGWWLTIFGVCAALSTMVLPLSWIQDSIPSRANGTASDAHDNSRTPTVDIALPQPIAFEAMRV